MRPRNFIRRFVEEFGTTPPRSVTRLRHKLARRILAENRLSRSEIAPPCGFGPSIRRSVQPLAMDCARGRIPVAMNDCNLCAACPRERPGYPAALDRFDRRLRVGSIGSPLVTAVVRPPLSARRWSAGRFGAQSCPRGANLGETAFRQSRRSTAKREWLQTVCTRHCVHQRSAQASETEARCPHPNLFLRLADQPSGRDPESLTAAGEHQSPRDAVTLASNGHQTTAGDRQRVCGPKNGTRFVAAARSVFARLIGSPSTNRSLGEPPSCYFARQRDECLKRCG